MGGAAPTGLLLVNLGTPDAPDTVSVRRYLREFLSDPRVIDLPAPARWALVYGVIAPLRGPRSAAAYRQIWTEAGSPLLVHGRALQAAVSERLGDRWEVELAMRYGSPSVTGAVGRLRDRGVARLVVLPLYPQYAASTTGSALDAVYRALARPWDPEALTVAPPFFDDPAFLRAWAQVARPHLDAFAPDHVVLSFHGLPERHLTRTHPPPSTCLGGGTCCETLDPSNHRCYRAQCFATARGLTQALGLDPGAVRVAFQSRVGRDRWIEPATDRVLEGLAHSGARRVAVLCPSFVADCLETLEEIGLRERAAFRAAGGEDLLLVPSLNATPAWVEAVCAMARRHHPDTAGAR